MELTDSEAAAEAQKGNQQAFRVLVHRHSKAVFHLAFRMTGNEQDAEDIVQETFLRAYKQLKRFDGRASFGTWLHRICANSSLDLLRARKNRKEQQVYAGDDESFNWLETVAGREPSPERLTYSRQISQLLAPALNGLSHSERTAFVLRHYEGFDIDQIADVLGIKANAAKQSVFRAVQKLRRALQPMWEVGVR